MKKVAFPALFAFQITVIAVLVFTLFAVPRDWNPARVAGVVLITLSATLLMIARYQLGTSFAITAQARTLVAHGIYSRIRNPIYVFGSVLIIGVCVFFQKPYLFLILAIVVPMQIWRAHREARVLEAKFGDSYRAYRSRTWF